MAQARRGKRNSEEENFSFFKSRQPKSSPDVEATLKRIKQHSGVLGVIVVNNEGFAIRTTLDNPTTQLYLHHSRHLIHLSRHTIRDIDPTDDLKFLRMRSKKNELVIAPEDGYTLIVIQAATFQPSKVPSGN
eukprot:Seg1985.3 transcript_id=Seg1985.3/GoldUCD/mRNA.D3Y31 product="Dynein light chain roadblock-type 1" protein_id=Seg1985.3/GoldUCD/D3Y31